MSSYLKKKRSKRINKKSILDIYKSVQKKYSKKLKKNSDLLRKSLKRIIKKNVYSPLEHLKSKEDSKPLDHLEPLEFFEPLDDLKIKNILTNMRLYEETYKEIINHSINTLKNDVMDNIKNKKLNKDLINKYIELLEDIKNLHICYSCESDKTISINMDETIIKLLNDYIRYFSSDIFKYTYRKYMELFFNESKKNKKIKKIDSFLYVLKRPIERIEKYKECLNELQICYQGTKYMVISELICKAIKSLELVEKCIIENNYCETELKDKEIICKKNKRISIFS